MTYQTQSAARDPPVTSVWFMVVDHEFNCTLGDPCPVDVPSDGSIFHLQQKIKALDWYQFKHSHYVELRVWKLRTPKLAREVKNKGYLASIKPSGGISDEEVEMEDEEEKETKGKGKAKARAKPIWRLLPSDEISLHLKEPAPQNRIQVLVQLPASATVTPLAPRDDYPSKRRRLADDLNPSWLEEVWSKIWNEERLVPQLFRRVEVTQAHYTELQRRLKQQHPDRDLPEYNGRERNVQGVKLDLLRSIPPLSPQHPDNNEDQVGHGEDPEAGNGDELDINSHFPLTLSFLDLSTLDLKKEIPDRLPLPLFLRQEYDDISALIEKEPRSKYGSVVVSGQPGTGKTAYLHLRMIQFMIEGRPFLYQACNRTVFYVNENGVEAIQSWPSNTDIVAFVDGDKDYEPHDMLIMDRVQIILASSPKGAGAKWIRQEGYIRTIACKLWSARELLIAGVFLHPLDISLELLKESTSYFGYNPRLCFSSAQSWNVLEDMKVNVRSRIRSVDFKKSNILQLVNSSWTGDSAVSHSIFEISPINDFRRLGECGFRTVSRWAFDCFTETYEAQEAHAATTFYRHISGTPAAASLWGHVFERRVLNRIDVGGFNFPIRGLPVPEETTLPEGTTLPEETTWTCRRRPIPRSKFLQESDFVEQITKAIQENKELHLVPSAPNFKAVDSILYAPNEVLTCIQATVSRKDHGILVPGLRCIQRWLGRGPLAHLRPKKDRPWRFIFVVPSDEAPTFEFQRFERDTAHGEWAGKVHQYVLGLDVLE